MGHPWRDVRRPHSSHRRSSHLWKQITANNWPRGEERESFTTKVLSVLQSVKLSGQDKYVEYFFAQREKRHTFWSVDVPKGWIIMSYWPPKFYAVHWRICFLHLHLLTRSLLSMSRAEKVCLLRERRLHWSSPQHFLARIEKFSVYCLISIITIHPEEFIRTISFNLLSGGKTVKNIRCPGRSKSSRQLFVSILIWRKCLVLLLSALCSPLPQPNWIS